MHEFVTNLISAWEYPGIAGLMLAENIFPPFPSEVILPFSGLLVARGELTFIGVWVASTIGSTLGAFIWYWIGSYFAEDRVKAWAARHGAWLGLGRRDVAKAYGWFEAHDVYSVFFGRLIPGVRTLISLPAGSARMPWKTFFAATLAGTMTWNTLLIGAGYLLRNKYLTISPYINFVLYTVIAVIVGLFVYRLIRQKYEQPEQPQKPKE